MQKDEFTFELVLAILGGGLLLSILSGDHTHWIPIILAFVVVGTMASKFRL
jgi:hypothetical protein